MRPLQDTLPQISGTQFGICFTGKDAVAVGETDIVTDVKIMKRYPQTDSFFCINDDCAMAVWGALNELGFRVPQDFALIGFDDLPAASSLRLASVRKPQKEMAQNAVLLLKSKLEKQTVEIPRIFSAEFVPRRSCMKI